MNNKMRWLPDVIEQMLAVIPVDQVELRQRLEWHAKDASFKAPEQMTACWNSTANTLNGLLGTDMSQEWQWDIQVIFSGEDDIAKELHGKHS